jgi:hypothetical protein
MSIFRKDHDGKWYSIPETLDTAFLALKDQIIESEIGSSEWLESTMELQSTFGEYLCQPA